MTRTPLALAAIAGLAIMTMTACGPAPSGSGAPPDQLRLLVSSAPGGGYDQTARAAANVMKEVGAVRSIQVTNVVGSNGVLALQKLVNEKGEGDVALQMGLGVVGAVATAHSDTSFADTVALAKMIEESSAIVVPADSPYDDLDQLLAAWKRDPRGVTVGGGSVPGGPDHLLPMQLADAVGIEPREVNYIPYDGGGELLPAILGSKISFAASGVSEITEYVKSGDLKVLAVSGEEATPELPGVPTIKDAGVDLVFSNWRGIVAPPGTTDADREHWIATLDRMHGSPEWQEQLRLHGWRDAYMTGNDFQTFLDEQSTLVDNVIEQLGLS